MARIRTVKPEFWTDEKIVGMTPFARLFFIGLWNFVDDDGRAPYSPSRLKMQILPADPADVSEILGEIRRNELIVVYEVDGKEYFQVCGFSKHQKVDNRAKSKHPPPPIPAEDSGKLGQEGKGKEGKGKDDAPIGATNFAFESGRIRLSTKNLSQWKSAFSNLEVEAELLGLSKWAEQQGDNWFCAVSGALAKRNREIGLRKTANGGAVSDFRSNPTGGSLF